MGWLFGFWGSFLWILFALHFIDYPGVFHPEIMMGGFILCFISGFITTAAPKFTNSFPATILDLRLSVIFTILQFVSLLLPNPLYFRLAALAQFFFLSWFVGIRYLNKKSNPPIIFLLIAFGLLSGIAGLLLLIYGLSPDLGRVLFLQTYVMCFILGIGSRLIPSLMGHEQRNFKVSTVLELAIMFVSSYVIEFLYSEIVGNLMKDFVVIFIAFYVWIIHKLPKRRGFQSWGLWISCWSIVLGFLAVTFMPTERIHLLHLVFVSGLSLLTLMIGTRVSLSHGNHDMSLEMKSRYLLATICLFILAGLTRSSAGFMPALYEHHLGYAALVWIAGLATWGWVFLPKIIK